MLGFLLNGLTVMFLATHLAPGPVMAAAGGLTATAGVVSLLVIDYRASDGRVADIGGPATHLVATVGAVIAGVLFSLPFLLADTGPAWIPGFSVVDYVPPLQVLALVGSALVATFTPSRTLIHLTAGLFAGLLGFPGLLGAISLWGISDLSGDVSRATDTFALVAPTLAVTSAILLAIRAYPRPAAGSGSRGA